MLHRHLGFGLVFFLPSMINFYLQSSPVRRSWPEPGVDKLAGMAQKPA